MTTHVFNMPNMTTVIKTNDTDALAFIREQMRLGYRLVNSYCCNGEFVYEMR